MDTTTLTYGSPAAKARIKELAAIERQATAEIKVVHEAAHLYAQASYNADPNYRSWEDPHYAELQAEGDEPRSRYYAARTERLALQTCPLPCQPIDLPAAVVPASVPLVPGPQTTAAYSAGDLVAVYSRGTVRYAVVVEARKSNLDVAYTTQGAITEAARYGRSPNQVCVTRKTVKLADVYNHEAKGVAAA